MPDVYTSKLSEINENAREDVILWRLAVAMGYAKPGDGFIITDTDKLLDGVVETIYRLKDLEY